MRGLERAFLVRAKSHFAVYLDKKEDQFSSSVVRHLDFLAAQFVAAPSQQPGRKRKRDALASTFDSCRRSDERGHLSVDFLRLQDLLRHAATEVVAVVEGLAELREPVFPVVACAQAALDDACRRGPYRVVRGNGRKPYPCKICSLSLEVRAESACGTSSRRLESASDALIAFSLVLSDEMPAPRCFSQVRMPRDDMRTAAEFFPDLCGSFFRDHDEDSHEWEFVRKEMRACFPHMFRKSTSGAPICEEPLKRGQSFWHNGNCAIEVSEWDLSRPLCEPTARPVRRGGRRVLKCFPFSSSQGAGKEK